MLGRFTSCAQTVAMKASVFLSVLAGLAAGQVQLPKHNLPELFSYDHGSHSVAVYRGAALKAAIAAGLVKGFPGSGAGAGDGAGGVDVPLERLSFSWNRVGIPNRVRL